MIKCTADFHSKLFADFLLYLIQFLMNLYKIFLSVYKNSIFSKKFGSWIFFSMFQTYFWILFYHILFIYDLKHKKFEHFVQSINNPCFFFTNPVYKLQIIHLKNKLAQNCFWNVFSFCRFKVSSIKFEDQTQSRNRNKM